MAPFTIRRPRTSRCSLPKTTSGTAWRRRWRSSRADEEAFEGRTLGLLVWGNAGLDLAVMPHLDDRLREFQARLWQVVTPFACGRIRDMDTPGRWIPHVTVKRGGSDRAAFGRALNELLGESFAWTFSVDNVMVEHDPGKNSRSHYQRLYFPLKGSSREGRALASSNAELLELTRRRTRTESAVMVAKGKLDAGSALRVPAERAGDGAPHGGRDGLGRVLRGRTLPGRGRPHRCCRAEDAVPGSAIVARSASRALEVAVG